MSKDILKVFESAFDKIVLDGDYINKNDIVMADSVLNSNHHKESPDNKYEREFALDVFMSDMKLEEEEDAVFAVYEIHNRVLDVLNNINFIKYMSYPEFITEDNIFHAYPIKIYKGIRCGTDWNGLDAPEDFNMWSVCVDNRCYVKIRLTFHPISEKNRIQFIWDIFRMFSKLYEYITTETKDYWEEEEEDFEAMDMRYLYLFTKGNKVLTHTGKVLSYSIKSLIETCQHICDWLYPDEDTTGLMNDFKSRFIPKIVAKYKPSGSSMTIHQIFCQYIVPSENVEFNIGYDVKDNKIAVSLIPHKRKEYLLVYEPLLQMSVEGKMLSDMSVLDLSTVPMLYRQVLTEKNVIYKAVSEHFVPILNFLRNKTIGRLPKLILEYDIYEWIKSYKLDIWKDDGMLDEGIKKFVGKVHTCDLRGTNVDKVVVRYTHKCLKDIFPVICDDTTEVEYQLYNERFNRYDTTNEITRESVNESAFDNINTDDIDSNDIMMGDSDIEIYNDENRKYQYYIICQSYIDKECLDDMDVFVDSIEELSETFKEYMFYSNLFSSFEKPVLNFERDGGMFAQKSSVLSYERIGNVRVNEDMHSIDRLYSYVCDMYPAPDKVTVNVAIPFNVRPELLSNEQNCTTKVHAFILDGLYNAATCLMDDDKIYFKFARIHGDNEVVMYYYRNNMEVYEIQSSYNDVHTILYDKNEEIPMSPIVYMKYCKEKYIAVLDKTMTQAFIIDTENRRPKNDMDMSVILTQTARTVMKYDYNRKKDIIMASTPDKKLIFNPGSQQKSDRNRTFDKIEFDMADTELYWNLDIFNLGHPYNVRYFNTLMKHLKNNKLKKLTIDITIHSVVPQSKTDTTNYSQEQMDDDMVLEYSGAEWPPIDLRGVNIGELSVNYQLDVIKKHIKVLK